MAVISRHQHLSRGYNTPFFDSLVDEALFLSLEPTDSKDNEDPEDKRDPESQGSTPSDSSEKRKWTPTPEAFSKLLASLSRDPDEAAEKYEIIRLKLVRFFEWRGCHSPDHLVDKAFDRVARRIDEGQIISNITAYFYSVADFLFKEWMRERERTTLKPEDLPTTVEPEVLNSENEDPRARCLDECLEALPEEDRNLILKYFTGERREKIEGRKELAAELKIPMNALRIRVHRIRKSLEKSVRACLGK